MKLNQIHIAASLLLFAVNGYAQNAGNLASRPCLLVKQGQDWKVNSFTLHRLAGEMTYASSDERIAKIDQRTGVIQPKAKGAVTITATQAGSTKAKGDKKSCALAIVSASSFLTWAVGEKTVMYEENKKVEVNEPTGSTKRPITYTSDKPNVANVLRVDGGKVIIDILDADTDGVTFTAQQEANDIYDKVKATFKLKINPQEGGIVFTAGNSGEIPLN